MRLKLELNASTGNIRQLEQKLIDYNELKRQRDEARADSTKLEDKAIMLIEESSQELEKPSNLRTYRKSLIESGLSERLERTFERAFTKQLTIVEDPELLKAYQNAVQLRLNEIFRLWRVRRLGKRTAGRKKKLRDKSLVNPFIALRGVWSIQCIGFGDDWPYRLTLDTYGIQRLLSGNLIEVPSYEVKARIDGRHTISVSLADIVKLYLEKWIDDR